MPLPKLCRHGCSSKVEWWAEESVCQCRDKLAVPLSLERSEEFCDRDSRNDDLLAPVFEVADENPLAEFHLRDMR
jgi:hypothetical protein